MAVIENLRVRKRDRSNENFKKKWSTLKNNGLIIHQGYNAEVYVCIRRKGEKYEFKSTDKALPLSDQEKVSVTDTVMFTVTNRVRQNESFPLPVLVTAEDVARHRNSQSSVKERELRQESSLEGPVVVVVGNPSSEPRGGSEVKLKKE
ncbi:hypothetical protein IWW34DRAFT_629653 [Fusarium oxysporum f. sp. albedinis]|nr:hypothetical protein IWW34DRAFT_629653 [Fusarium oxysporum f. sp. albedinis]KAJ0135515.1 E3 ubiquitin-protein ligase [Fusarium oxysporum f. sp. albedinis]KAK2477155.1 hypothetical protein H9L39_12379 [Fusarium oxysporum f. sp. albedinis]